MEHYFRGCKPSNKLFVEQKKRMKMNEMKFYHVVQTNEEGTDWVVAIGNLLATPKHFKTKEEAEEWAENPKWEMIVAMILYIMEKQNEIDKCIKPANDGNN